LKSALDKDSISPSCDLAFARQDASQVPSSFSVLESGVRHSSTMSHEQFEAGCSPRIALVVDSPEQVAE
jgi:hypothetical protein